MFCNCVGIVLTTDISTLWRLSTQIYIIDYMAPRVCPGTFWWFLAPRWVKQPAKCGQNSQTSNCNKGTSVGKICWRLRLEVLNIVLSALFSISFYLTNYCHVPSQLQRFSIKYGHFWYIFTLKPQRSDSLDIIGLRLLTYSFFYLQAGMKFKISNRLQISLN